MQLWAGQSGREHRSRIGNVTVSIRLRLDFVKVNVLLKSRFAFTTPFNTRPPPLSLRYVIRGPRQRASVADADEECSRI